jgi:cytochrome c oxidase subunit 4
MNASDKRSRRTHRSGPEPPSLRSNLWVFGALLALLAASAGSAFIPMGAFNEFANIGIAVIKAMLVMTFFMRLKSDSPLLRMVASVGFAWLTVMIVLSLADVLTRAPLLLPG